MLERALDEPEATASPMRILVVDDVDLNRDLVSALLAPLGHDISEAADGAEAVEAVKGGDFDIVLMDVQMSGMNGQDATRAIRAPGWFRGTPNHRHDGAGPGVAVGGLPLSWDERSPA